MQSATLLVKSIVQCIDKIYTKKWSKLFVSVCVWLILNALMSMLYLLMIERFENSRPWELRVLPLIDCRICSIKNHFSIPRHPRTNDVKSLADMSPVGWASSETIHRSLDSGRFQTDIKAQRYSERYALRRLIIEILIGIEWTGRIERIHVLPGGLLCITLNLVALLEASCVCKKLLYQIISDRLFDHNIFRVRL